MKKLIVSVMLFSAVAAGNVFAAETWPADEDIAVKVSKAVEAKAALGAFEVGDYLFTLRKEKEFESKDGTTYTYFYRAENGPAVFREAVSKDIKTGEVKLISDSFVKGRVIGPLRWHYEDYVIQEIQVNIYPTHRLGALQHYWNKLFGKECVGLYLTVFGGANLEALNTPQKAFTTKDGKTVLITALAQSANYGPYKRECKLHAPGVLYKQFMKAADKLKKQLK